MTLIQTKFDELILRINDVKIYQEQWQLIIKSLNQFRNCLNEINGLINNENIEEIFEILTKLTLSCNENERNFNRINYQDFQSLFYRLQWYLTQYQTNILVEHETKLEKLLNSYHNMQILLDKTYDQTIRQRLDEIEKSTRENTIEQHRLLRDKHSENIEIYLRHCIEMNKTIFLNDFIPTAINRVIQTFYQISSSQDSIQFRLTLIRPLTQFESDKLTNFERNEYHRLLNICDQERISKDSWQQILSTPYMHAAAIKTNLSMSEDIITIEDILRKKRLIVILGEAGCGKSCFIQWLANYHAEKYLQNELYSTLIGPIRIPILIEINDFIHRLELQPSLTLFDYIHKDFLQDSIEQGQTLIILDGLDQISDSIQRSKIIKIIENFVEIYVQIPNDVTVKLNNPSKFEGNQLIVTSRIIRYYTVPLDGQFAHYTIQPMNIDDMKQFIKYWFYQIHQQILDYYKLTVVNQGEIHANKLINELEKTENLPLINLTGNPALTCLICQISFNQLDDTPLPMPHIHQYNQIIELIFKQWTRRCPKFSQEKLIRILSDIAFNIQQYNPLNYLDEEEMIEICFRSIKIFKNKLLLTPDDVQKLENESIQLIRIIQENFGLFKIYDHRQYGFQYRTLQDYFTTLHFIEWNKSRQKNSKNDIQFFVQSLRHHFNDLRFRYSIKLLFGYISTKWSLNEFDEFSRYFIEQDEQQDMFLPLGSYIFLTSSEEMINYPSNEIFFTVLDRLMISAGQYSWSTVCPFLFEQITKSLRKLHHDIISLWIDHFLNHSIHHDIRTIEAFCYLIEGKSHDFENIQWLDQSSCSILQTFSTHEYQNNRFFIDRLLVKVAFSHYQLLPIHRKTFKGYLLDADISVENIPITLLPLIIILYGGLKREDQNVIFDPSYIHRESTIMTPILIDFFSVTDQTKQAMKRLRQECINLFLTHIENHNESHETIDLSIAIICLFGIEYIQENLTIITQTLLRLIMERLKYILMILRQFYFSDKNDDRSVENDVTKFIAITMENFQYIESARAQFLDLLNILKCGIARLRSSKTSILIAGETEHDKRITLHLPNSLRKERFLYSLLSADIQIPPRRSSCSLLYHFKKLFSISENDDEFNTQYRTVLAMDEIPDYLTLYRSEDILSTLVYIPSHLQSLYLRLLQQQQLIIINSTDVVKNEKNCLYFGHILTECLINLSNPSYKGLMILTALINLLPWLRMQNLDTFGSSLLWSCATKDLGHLGIFESKRQLPIIEETDYDEDNDQNTIKNEDIFREEEINDEERVNLIKAYINEEHERIRCVSTENNGRNMTLYSASISLAHISRWSEDERRLPLLNESVKAAMSITNKLVQLVALCVIALYSYTDHDQIQLDTNRFLQEEIEYQFNEIYPTLSLLLHTAIFIRCLPHLQNYQTVDRSLRNLFDKFADNDQRDQHAVSEALSPYLQFNCSFSLPTSNAAYHLFTNSRIIRYKSSIMKKYFNSLTDQPFALSVLISNLYLIELTNDVQLCLNNRIDRFTIEELNSSMLTEAQAMRINKVISYVPLVAEEQDTIKLDVLSDALHRINKVELKARHVLEGWLKWKDSDELSEFAYHAALLLTNSDFWSVNAAVIVCDLLRHENDRFRRRAEIFFRSSNNDNVQTSSNLGIDILLILMKRKIHYDVSSSSARLNLNRLCGNITLDNQSHLEILLWLERYRNHALINRNYPLELSRLNAQSYISSYFSSDLVLDASCCVDLFRLSDDLIAYMCDMIANQFFSFLEIDGDSISDAVLHSHIQFIVSVIASLNNILNSNDGLRRTAFDALMTLFDTSDNDNIRQAVAYAFGYVCSGRTYKELFDKIQAVSNNGFMGTSEYSDYALAALISSYCYCIAIHKIAFDQDDMDLFSNLLRNSSEIVANAVRTGYGRALRDKPLLIGILDNDHTLSYRALVEATAYFFLYDVQESSEIAAADFIEQNPVYLSLFIMELYNRISHFDHQVKPMSNVEYNLAYGYPQYVKIASLVAERNPTVFCSFVNDWPDGEKLKRALYYTSKQHNFPQRGACLITLSMFGVLTVDLCEMLIEAMHDDPYIQNISYKCLTRITTINNEETIISLLQKYFQSKSMNFRYLAARILLRLSQLSLISIKQVQTMLNTVMLDSHSNETLWLIASQNELFQDTVYNYIGSLKDAIYFLLVQYLTGETSEIIRREELNYIDSDFIESEKAACLSSCLYELKSEKKDKSSQTPTLNHNDNTDSLSLPSLASTTHEDNFD